MAFALGARSGTVAMQTDDLGSTGGTYVAPGGGVLLATLDSFEIPVIDLLKVDCEGYEFEVLSGAIETLQQCRPVVAVEQRARTVAHFKHGPIDAVKLLQKLGARQAWTDKSDYVLVFP